MLSSLLGFFKSGKGKWLAIALIVSTLTSFFVWGYNSVYEAGYNRASLEYQQELTKKLNEEVNKAKVEWEKENSQAIEVVEKEKEVSEKVKTVYRDVYKTVYKCESVGEETLELLNRVIKKEG